MCFHDALTFLRSVRLYSKVSQHLNLFADIRNELLFCSKPCFASVLRLLDPPSDCCYADCLCVGM